MADLKIDGQTYTDVDMLNLEDTDGNEAKYYNDENLRLDYSNQITDKPKINGVELNGDLTPEQLGLNGGGGGSEKQWKLIRTITIPEDITTDTSGVNFAYATADTPENGVLFGFDTDENGEPFECSELIIYALNASHGSSYGSASISFDSSIPTYGGISTYLKGINGNKKNGTGITIIKKLTDTNIISFRAVFGGGGENTLTTDGRQEKVSIDVISKMKVYISNGGGFGIMPSSKITIFGR